MKRRLLNPPALDGEIMLTPSLKEINDKLNDNTRVAVAHQPYFFNSGVSIKFLLLKNINKIKKKIIFVDTDKVNLKVNVPFKGGIKIFSFIDAERILRDYPSPSLGMFSGFFSFLEDLLRQSPFRKEILENFFLFKDIAIKKIKKKFLKEILAEAFLDFYGIKENYSFLSDVLKTKKYKDFFLKIYREHNSFRNTFNRILDDYRRNFKFRYKNFPFPKLADNELPFWIVREKIRCHCFIKDLEGKNFKDLTILPRASTLTLFLRLYCSDMFIHGVGGANYEWVQDRLIERFFKKDPPLYAVVSGTFLLSGLEERQLPYFFFSAQNIEDSLKNFLKKYAQE